jgi:hypothetical protein
MLRCPPMAPNADNIVNCRLLAFLVRNSRSRPAGPPLDHSANSFTPYKYEALSALVSVDVSMRKIAALPKLADMKKKDARLTIRIPRELKAKIEGIERVYGVALPKIANECLRAFCAYVEQKKQTPTFPLCISPHSPDDKTPNHASVRRRRRRNGQRQRI